MFPERREVEIAHVLFLPLGRPAAIDVGEVVVTRGLAFASNGPRGPHRREGPPIELRRGRDDDRFRVGKA